jgi:hypothetical protein
MGALVGIVKLGTYDGATADANIDRLLALLPNPNAVLDQVVNSSGAIAGGGLLDEISPAALAQLRVELQAMKDASAGGGTVFAGQHTVTAADATANLVNIVTGKADLVLANVAVTVTRAGSIVTADAVITEPTAGSIRVADGVTYNTTAGDLINWAVVA